MRDGADAPVFGAKVRAVWTYRLAGAPPQEISTLTDPSGILRFPAGAVRASPFDRLRAILAVGFDPEPHTDDGPTGSITARAPGHRTASVPAYALAAGTVLLTLTPDPTWRCP